MAEAGEIEAGLRLLPIGRVVKGRPWPDTGDRWEEAEAEIEIEDAWAEALDGIEGFSHIWIIWWPDRAGELTSGLRVHPEGREEIPLTGVFATRSPRRPNPITMTVVRLLDCEGNRLRVQGLDACQDSPVLDIKPYLRRGDLHPEATMPAWIEELWRMHDEGG
jgi:tRNA-Thr(GGU) m(6)t(6)A37 methyltransferase TsaA